MRVWLAVYDCGDYYCDGEHPIGVYSTEEAAHAAGAVFLAEELLANPRRYADGWSTSVCGPYDIDAPASTS